MLTGKRLVLWLIWVSILTKLPRRRGLWLGSFTLVYGIGRLLLKWRAEGRLARVRRAPTPTIAIAGTGLAGLCLAIKLKQRGIESFVLYEKSGDVGGTWRANSYPGCACDVPVHLYQPSFDLESGWPSRYASQRDLQRNIKRLFLKHDLMRHVVFHTEVTSAEWQDSTHGWQLQLHSHSEQKRYPAKAAIFVSCVGQLSVPKFPKCVLNNEQKKSTHSSSSSSSSETATCWEAPYANHVHTGAWREDIELNGKTVAIVGSAASAVQVLGPVAERAKQVYVFQRTPNWMMPQWKYQYPRWLRATFRYVPALMRVYRWWLWMHHEIGYLGFLKNNAAHRLVAWFLMKYMKRHASRYQDALANKQTTALEDSELSLIQADGIDLLPTYDMGCKRILMESNWYGNISRPNVVVVNKGICAVEQHSLSVHVHDTKTVQLAVDVVIYCTGFHSTKFLHPVKIIGKNKQDTLERVWNASQHHAYLGMTIPAFPNLFVMYGPYTNLGHNSITFQLECQADYIVNIAEAMALAGVAAVDVKPQVVANYFESVHARLAKTVWNATCGNWYAKDGVVINNSPWTTTEYWLRTRNSATTYLTDYNLTLAV